MSQVELLTRAIEKLEALKAESTLGPWGGHQNILGVDRILTVDGYIVAEVYGDDSQESNAELIVTLHRTIDAQLAILKAALDDFVSYGGKPSKFFENDLALAHAVLGDDV